MITSNHIIYIGNNEKSITYFISLQVHIEKIVAYNKNIKISNTNWTNRDLAGLPCEQLISQWLLIPINIILNK